MSKTVDELNVIVAGLSGIRSAVEQIQRECAPGSPAWYTFSGLLNEITKVAQGAASVASSIAASQSSATAPPAGGDGGVQRTVSASTAKRKLKNRVASKPATSRPVPSGNEFASLFRQLVEQQNPPLPQQVSAQTLSLQELLSMLSGGGGMLVEIGSIQAPAVKEGQNSCCEPLA